MRRFPFWAGLLFAVLIIGGAAWRTIPAFGAPTPRFHAPGNYVEDGTVFLVRLEGDIDSGTAKTGSKFEVKTIEPLQTSSGSVLPTGERISGHVSRVEAAGLAGRARLWLTFDDIETSRGSFPVVAEVSSVPGEYSVRSGPKYEGEIEATGDTPQAVAESTAGGALKGAVPGVTSHNAKTAAVGAATSGVTAFLASSGLGKELTLAKGTKLEIQLLRPLYLPK